jgi:AcrR family transcriptional regulator
MPRTSRADEIIAVAAGVLERDGLDRFVMRHIADLAGMKLGNLQYYFPTRDDLLDAVVRSTFADDLAAINSATVEAPDRRLARIVRTLSTRWSLHNGSAYLPIAVLALHNRRFRKTLSEIYATFYELICDIVTDIDPHATQNTAQRRAFLITSLLDGASLQPGRNDPAISDSLVDDLTQLTIAIAKGL